MRLSSPERDVLIRNRSDGVTELSPRLSPLEPADRWAIIVTVAIAAWGFFLAGTMPGVVFLVVLAFCLVGELVLGAKLLLLALLRPQADVVKIPQAPRRRLLG